MIHRGIFLLFSFESNQSEVTQVGRGFWDCGRIILTPLISFGIIVAPQQSIVIRAFVGGSRMTWRAWRAWRALRVCGVGTEKSIKTSSFKTLTKPLSNPKRLWVVSSTFQMVQILVHSHFDLVSWQLNRYLNQ